MFIQKKKKAREIFKQMPIRLLTNEKLMSISRGFVCFFIFFEIMSCNQNKSEEKAIKEIIPDTNNVSIRHTGFEEFNEAERSSLDSVATYQLSAILDSCIKYIYVIHGNELLQDSIFKGISLGECNIRLLEFTPLDGNKRKLTFGAFVHDSIPAGIPLQLSYGGMINSFSVDVKQKRILLAFINEGRIQMKNITDLYHTALNHKAFKSYIQTHASSIHPKFRKLLKL